MLGTLGYFIISPMQISSTDVTRHSYVQFGGQMRRWGFQLLFICWLYACLYYVGAAVLRDPGCSGVFSYPSYVQDIMG